MRRLVLFASYHSDADLPGYIRYHLEALRPFAERLVYISNSPVSDAGEAYLNGIGADLVRRGNSGFDFGAWRDVLGEIDTTPYDEILLTNSSIIGPLFSLKDVFDGMEKRECDFWGLTANRMFKKHIQSFFLCFRKSLHQTADWNRFWQSVEDFEDKNDVIRRYEVGLTEHFENLGYRSATFIPLLSLPIRDRFSLRWFSKLPIIPIPVDRNHSNLTVNAPLLLVDKGFPYLKASIVWGHNTRQPFPFDAIRRHPKVDYDWDLVDEQLDAKRKTELGLAS